MRSLKQSIGEHRVFTLFLHCVKYECLAKTKSVLSTHSIHFHHLAPSFMDLPLGLVDPHLLP